MGRIASVKRMAVHDGPGLRTTIFFKGCPLHCIWCHNPECISTAPEVAYIAKKCINCCECLSLCDANLIIGNTHVFERANCTSCGKCEKICLGGAFTFYGREVTVDEAAQILLEDRAFYASSGGGITLSGGEPLMQPNFAAALLCRMKEETIHTAVDTSGFCSRMALDMVAPFTDIFLYDMKSASPKVHEECTGQRNEVIIDNLRYLSEMGKNIEIRIPLIPGKNDGEMEGIAEILSSLRGISLIRVLPYHPFSASKYLSLGFAYGMPEITRPDKETMARAVAVFTDRGLHAVNGGNLP